MQRFEYKVVPAPERAGKQKGVKGAARFAATLEGVMNDLGAEGWQYLRADILPETERAGLTGTQVTYRTMLVFQRPVPDPEPDAPPPEPLSLAPPPAYSVPDALPDLPDPAPERDPPLKP